ncbi:MAG: DUF1840 domain-containing protein [Aquincola sp.]|uniref:DUF1840 domain-containing protein n=1 Tax=uncultured Aquincola sp. TaxID=886556 RepID=UPI0032B26021|nr:DUF1840 domain-containing protein [Aquincola sp.]|tara:strand:- start:5721 stop:6047 length:327 start_codon:yes stop_codon:yes gene_type:complete
MIYKFKSKAAPDVIMMGPNGDQVLRLIGREPTAKGILEVADMPAAVAALRAAVEEEDARRQATPEDEADDDGPRGSREGVVSLRQRAWPLIEMIERSHKAGTDVVWGV